jgi:hypothetical protein
MRNTRSADFASTLQHRIKAEIEAGTTITRAGESTKTMAFIKILFGFYFYFYTSQG